MMEVVRRGVPTGAGTEMHFERFSPLPVVGGASFELQLAHSAEVVGVGGNQSALAALRSARPDVSYSCRQGFCGTCVQRVLDGEVDHRDTILSDMQRADGQMLVCVSRAKSAGARLVLDL
jgi:ferredoxin